MGHPDPLLVRGIYPTLLAVGQRMRNLLMKRAGIGLTDPTHLLDVVICLDYWIVALCVSMTKCGARGKGWHCKV